MRVHGETIDWLWQAPMPYYNPPRRESVMHEVTHLWNLPAGAEVDRYYVPLRPRGRSSGWVDASWPDPEWMSDAELLALNIATVDFFIAGPMGAAIERAERVGRTGDAGAYLHFFVQRTAPGQPDLRHAVNAAFDITGGIQEACALVAESVERMADLYAKHALQRTALQMLADRLMPYERLDGSSVQSMVEECRRWALGRALEPFVTGIASISVPGMSLPPPMRLLRASINSGARARTTRSGGRPRRR